ncbi:hypothetical protein GUITHDRAFT_52813, partial [Guillardia theta CCMP2712]
RRISDVGAENSLRKCFLHDMRMISRVRHPCITTVIGAVTAGRSGSSLVLEYMEYGSLYDLLRNNTVRLETEIMLDLLQDITSGIIFLHNSNPVICHKDLKSQNVLIDENFRAKITDFGLSQKEKLGQLSFAWLAPEVINGGDFTVQNDSYAFGILLSEIYSRKDPYEGEDISTVLREVADLGREVDKRPSLPPNVPGEILGLIKDCWHKQPEYRPLFPEISRRLKAL